MARGPIFHAVAFSARRPWLLLCLGMALALLSIGYAATHFALTTNTSALISPDVDWRKNEAALNTAFPQLTDTTLAVIDGETPELAEAGAAALAERLAADRAHFRTVRRPDGGDYLARQGVMFESLADVRATTKSLITAQPLLGPLAADPSLRGIAGALGTMLTGVERGSAKLGDLDRPIRALDDALGKVAHGRPAYFSWQALFADGGGQQPPLRRLILAQPVLDFGALKPGEKAIAAIQAAAADLKLDAAHGVQVQVTGEVPLADEEFSTLEENIGLVGLVMALAMLVTLWFATRSGKIVLAIVATIVTGLVVTTAVGLAAVHTLNLISVAFIPLFVGLGVDFGIQISVRFNAERLDGAAIPQALERAAVALGAPLALAAAAIFLGFGAFLPTDYVGISELGIIAGLGMLVALALSITLLPALLVLLKPGKPTAEVGFAEAAPVDRWLHAHRRQVLWAFGLSMLGSIVLLPLVQFDFNPLHLRDPHGPAYRALSDLMRDPLRTPNTISVLATDADAARALADRVAKRPEVAQAIAIDSFIPADQPAKLALLQDASVLLDLTLNPFDSAPPPSDAETIAALRATQVQLERVAAGEPSDAADHARALATTLGEIAGAPLAIRARASDVLVPPLNVMLNQARALLQAEAVTRETLPPDIAADWLAKDGRARVQIFPRGDSNDNAVLASFTRAVRAVAPQATGLPVATQEAAKTVAWAFVQAGLLALVLVSLLLFLVLRDAKEVAFTLAPVVLSGFLTLGSCVLIGQPINFANIIAFPLLFGVGVAFHIYFVMAWRAGETDLLQSSLARAVLFSALATGSAFGALWLSAHPGTASMGKILVISLAWTLVCALIFEPALLGPPRVVAKKSGGKARPSRSTPTKATGKKPAAARRKPRPPSRR
ncbi:MMPL family transporter [Sphingomonas sp. 28-63-12]|uniref:hopanoid transporter HpnN n=1 Tax=Sphingomonas sp. 28-63-12 TaxID=1970434 RepID=UPI000BDCA158|nr:MAG: hopanoid biosynthesis-associated RND transporter HpnN [Sphingomonas sp. 28-63-12]